MGNTTGARKPETVSTKQERIARLARNNPSMAFTSLNHYLDYAWMYRAYQLTRKDGATGVDAQTAQDYASELEVNLRSLLTRIKTGRYCAPMIKRTYIPKGDGQQRALGIPTFEDKIAQRAVAMLLEPLYEQDFHDCSYGFRRRRSAHQALQSVRNQILDKGGHWVLEVDIQKYFDTIDHRSLREFLARRVADGVLRKLIDKWLKAGILEGEQIYYPTQGTPQGGVVSPLLANIYLHYVLDEWFAKEVSPRMMGRVALTRYCDDFVMVFERHADCDRVHRVIDKRFARYGLSLHPDKTRRVDFRFCNRKDKGRRGVVVNFDFLGFTHYWERSRKGRWVVRQKTAKGRVARTLKSFNRLCCKNRHKPLPEQQALLNGKLRGHYAYFGITGNIKALQHLARRVNKIWHKWLGRRSRKSYIPWKRFKVLLRRFPLEPPRIVHQYTNNIQLPLAKL